MASTSETGHAKNVANFEDLISFCIAYGAAYNPGKDALTIAKLQQLQTQATAALQQAKISRTGFDNATNERQLAFKELKALATKVVNSLAASGASELAVADAKSINRKLQGTKSNAPKPVPATGGDLSAPTPTDKTISNSQQSYDFQVDHFERLIESVSQQAAYTPNEAGLKTAALQTKLAELKTANTALINGYTEWSNARIARNAVLYSPLTGLVQTALDVKKYVKSVFGAGSPQFKQVSSLQFRHDKGL